MKFLIPNALGEMNTWNEGIMIAPRVADCPRVMEIMRFWREYRLKGIALKFRTAIKHMYTSLTDGSKAYPRLAVVHTRSINEFNGVKNPDLLKLSGRYKELPLHNNWCITNRTPYVDGDSGRGPLRKPWLLDVTAQHSCFYIVPVNLSAEFMHACSIAGHFDLFLYVEFRTRRFIT